MEQLQLNEHNKQEYPPMHTAEHILNQTMVRMFGCGRAISAHIERKKSKCDYRITIPPTDEEIEAIAEQVNQIIAHNYPIHYSYMPKCEAIEKFDLQKLPHDAVDMLQIVSVGDYDACPCVGLHVEHTNQIGMFVIASTDYKEGVFRIRFKLM